MPFDPSVTEQLRSPLNSAKVKTRSQAGQNLSYIEGHHAIREANRIFGFDAWDRETCDLRIVQEIEVGGKWRVAYTCRVRISVDRTTRDGIGYGQGINQDLGSAHESAIKEAETDAMKRALMTFGDPFGLALYDKAQEHVDKGGKKVADGEPWLLTFLKPEHVQYFKDDCAAKGFDWLDIATRARANNVKDGNDLQRYVADKAKQAVAS